MRYKYVNRHKYPLYLTDSRGGSRLFTPGEWDDNIWWSRFLNPTQLTREPLTDSELASRRKRGVKVTAANHTEFVPWSPRKRQRNRGRRGSISASACASSCMVACEMETQAVIGDDRWVQIGETYFCKHCDWSTEDANVAIRHFNQYHKQDEEDGADG